jgi:hypothetical protein
VSSIDENWKKTVIRSTRYSPALMDMIKTECAFRKTDFSRYIRYAAMVAMKHGKMSDRSTKTTGYDNSPEPQREWFVEWREVLQR